MRPRLSLITKGLILVSIPLIFEAGIVLLLTHFQEEAESEARRAVEARTLSDKVTQLTSDLYVLYGKVSTVGPALRSGRLDRSYQPAMQKVLAEFEELDNLTRNNPAVNQNVRKSRALVTEAKEMMAMGLREFEAGNLDKLVATYQDKTLHLGALLNGILSQDLMIVAKDERSVANDSLEKQAQLRARVMQVAYCALAGSFIFTIILGWFFYKTIVTRLNVMGDNAVRLASDQPLNDRLQGHDEIAELDLAFHQMAETIIEVSRTKQELVGMLTHDLRTPLTFIQGCLDMMTQGVLGDLNDRGRKLVKLASRNSFLMMGLINDLLDSQKIQSNMMTIDFQEVCVAEVFEDVRLNIADWVEEHGIKIKIQDSDLFVSGDQDKICRVLLNLVSNAVKYSKEGDTISLGAVPAPGNQVELTVADQGPGIPKHMLRAVFDRFQQVSKDPQAKQGSGLGLAICQDLVSVHGGKIWVTSQPGRGSTFHFTLPAS